jgi:hypothetical protein
MSGMNLNHRNHIDFNDGWLVRLPTGPFAAFNDGPPKVTEVTLPHDALREQTRTPDAPAGTASGYHPSAAFTYEKTWDVPADWAGKWVALQFDGVASNALVYLNGVLVGQRPYTYARFAVDLTALLKPGQSNHLRVEVRSHKDSRWYTGAGIYRGVELLVADPLHFVPDSLWASTVRVENGTASIDVSATVVNSGLYAKAARVRFSVQDPAGAEVAVREVPVTTMPTSGSGFGAAASEHTAESQILQHIEIENAQLWSADSPSQYSVHAMIVAAAEAGTAEVCLSAERAFFGIRTVTVDPVRGLRINGEPVKLRGACIHVDNGLLGAVSLPAAELRKVAKLKEAGYNAVRISHNPASQAFLDACDQLGMLVMNEAFDTWSLEKSEFDHARNFAQWWERDIESLVFGSRNHASVIMYSIGNEIPELGTIGGRIWNRRIATKVRSLDSTRPVTNGINTLLTIDVGDLLAQAGGLNAFMGDTGDISAGFANIAVTPPVSNAIEEVASALDVVGYNYAETRYALDLQENPHRVVVGSETFPKTIVANWKLVQQYPHVIGDFTWTGWDYLGEVGIGAVAYKEDTDFNGQLGREFPYLLAYCGDIDITGYRRPASYYREIAFGLRANPFIAVQDPSKHNQTQVSTSPWAWADVVEGWSWAGFEGKPIRVEVYSNAQEVELLLNGESVGRQPVAQVNAGALLANSAHFEIAHQTGELVAVAYIDGAESGRTVVLSAVGAPQLKLELDNVATRIKGDGQDLAHVAVSIVDPKGVLFNQAQEELTVTVSGPAVLAGFGSSVPNPTVPYTSNVQTTWDGRALAIIRATGAGEITVTVSGETVGERSLSFIAG